MGGWEHSPYVLVQTPQTLGPCIACTFLSGLGLQLQEMFELQLSDRAKVGIDSSMSAVTAGQFVHDPRNNEAHKQLRQAKEKKVKKK